MRRILITGAAGFVGQHVIAGLSRASCPTSQIIGVGRGDPGHLPDGVVFHRVDLLDRAELADLLERVQPSDILHLAATSSVQQSSSAPIETWHSNVGGLLNIADAVCKFAPLSNFFFVSSGEVYGRSFLSGRALTEEAETVPIGSYARSKLIGEQILADIFVNTDVKFVIMRPFNHIGPGQDERFVVPSFANQIAQIEAGLLPPIVEVGNLNTRRDFLPVGDVVQAYIAIISNIEMLSSGAVFNVASGIPRSILSILDELRVLSLTDFEVRVAIERVRPTEITVAAGDSTNLINTLGWRPTHDWNVVLSNIIDYSRRSLFKNLQSSR